MTSAASAAETPSPQDSVPLVAAVVPLVPAWAVDRTFDYVVPERFATKMQVGSVVRVPFGGRKVRGVVTDVAERVPDRELEEIAGVPIPEPMIPAPLLPLYEWIAHRYTTPRSRSYERAVPPRVRVNKPPVEPLRALGGPNLISGYEGGTELLSAISSGSAGVWLLHPDPRHDRAALFSELLSAAGAADDGGALVAVPEVRYGSAVMDRLAKAFPEMARVDSSVDEMDRSTDWVRMARGHGLAIGGRAVVFAPCRSLRLIVVDDEHDSVYKEDRAPRYDARRVAVERARLQGAVCVLVSSSPSLETGAAADTGRFEMVAPPRQALREARPVVELVEPPEDGGLSSELHGRLRDVLRSGASAALLAPHSGYASALWCAACRRSVRCPRCEAGLIFERGQTQVRCRRCAAQWPPPDVCPSCGVSDFRYVGRGSERFAEQLAKAFPRVPVVHMDRASADETRSWTGSGIYITTWFGTKPELRPPVALAGVIDADALTRRPDFRAAEQAHQVLTELSEWAGPAADGGRMVIQTRDPNHHAIQAIVRGDRSFFLRRELELRRELSYPPFTELIKVSATGEAAPALLEEVAGLARSHEARVLGPIAAPFPSGGRTGRGGRRDDGLQLLLKCPQAMPVAEGLRDILPRVPRGTRLRVDVDPR